jgi:hypothetical protein
MASIFKIFEASVRQDLLDIHPTLKAFFNRVEAFVSLMNFEAMFSAVF